MILLNACDIANMLMIKKRKMEQYQTKMNLFLIYEASFLDTKTVLSNNNSDNNDNSNNNLHINGIKCEKKNNNNNDQIDNGYYIIYDNL